MNVVFFVLAYDVAHACLSFSDDVTDQRCIQKKLYWKCTVLVCIMVHPRARGRQGRTGNNNVSSGNKSGVVNGTRGNTSKTTTDQPVFTSLSDR
jgi:penicillin V acylase-like amidase (Ntn superfamily)